MKAFAEEAPELFLHILGLRAGANVKIQPLRQETSPPAKLPDYVAGVRIESGEPVIFHAEFESTYNRDVGREIVRKAVSLSWQYNMPVESTLMLLRARGTPATIPAIGEYIIGATHVTHPFKVKRMWEMDPQPVLRTNNARLLPWAMAMRITDEMAWKIGAFVGQSGDEEAIARFYIMGSVRYDRSTLNEMLGGRTMGLVRALLDASSIVQEERDSARQEGRMEGRLEGRRDVLRVALGTRYPDLLDLKEIDRISNLETLQSLVEMAYSGVSHDSIRQAILNATAEPH
jgi:hypothetical protein